MTLTAARSAALCSLLFLTSCEVPSPGKAPPPPAPPPASAPPPSATIAAPALPEPLPPPPPEPIRVRFLSVGDVIFGRRVQMILDEKADPEHPFHPFAALYAAVDFTFANLENPFFSGKKPNVTPPGKRYAVLWSKPDHVKSLVKHKFSAVNLANNHAMDQDLAGVEETIRTLDENGIVHVGAGATLDAAWTPMFMDVRGLKIGFVGASYTSRNDMGLSYNRHVARIEDEARLAEACKKARAGAHFVVVTMHAGDEHKFVVNVKQRAFAKAAVRAGADMVIGAHPHVVQPIEKIDGKWVFYSLGNFIFDQPASDNSEALAVELHLSLQPKAERADLEKLVLHPVVIEKSAPGPANDERAARILKRAGVQGRELTP